MQSKRVWTRVTVEKSHSTNLHVHHANKMMLIWCNAVEMSLHGTKYSRWPTAWVCYMIVRSPALSLRYLFSSSVTVHSRIPISNFSKCASITCWTEHRNIQYFIERILLQNLLSQVVILHLHRRETKGEFGRKSDWAFTSLEAAALSTTHFLFKSKQSLTGRTQNLSNSPPLNQRFSLLDSSIF